MTTEPCTGPTDEDVDRAVEMLRRELEVTLPAMVAMIDELNAPAFEVVAEMVYDADDDSLVEMCGMCGTRPVADGDDLCERCGA